LFAILNTFFQSGVLSDCVRHSVSSLSSLKSAQLRGASFAKSLLAVGVVSRLQKQSQVFLLGGNSFDSVVRVISSAIGDPQTCLSTSRDGNLIATGTAEGLYSFACLFVCLLFFSLRRCLCVFSEWKSCDEHSSSFLLCEWRLLFTRQQIYYEVLIVFLLVKIISLIQILKCFWRLLFTHSAHCSTAQSNLVSYFAFFTCSSHCCYCEMDNLKQ
jgi:hypothetical protein